MLSPDTILRRAQPWLGTMVEIGIVRAKPSANQHAAITAAFAAIAEVHQAMSPQIEDSDIAQINRYGMQAVVCKQHTSVVLSMAHSLALQSENAFDVSKDLRGSTGWAINENLCIKTDPSLQIDLGGIAKGYAVDCAVACLKLSDIEAGWVNAGGDLFAFGSYEHPVHIRSCLDAAITRPLTAISNGAIASSVLKKANGIAHISVAAPTAMLADALTKVVAYAKHSVRQALLETHTAHAWEHVDF